MDARHVKAVKVALAEIDTDPTLYETKTEQLQFLGNLINRHRLETDGKKYAIQSTSLTPEKYRQKLQDLLVDYSSNMKNWSVKGNPSKILQLFTKGSAVIKQEYLEKLGYKRPVKMHSHRTLISSEADATSYAEDADDLPDVAESDQLVVTSSPRRWSTRHSQPARQKKLLRRNSGRA